MSPSIPNAWRTRLPPFLTEPIRRYGLAEEDAAATLMHAMTACDALGRYLVAILSAANEGKRPKTVDALIKRIESPTLGLWWSAVLELASSCAQNDTAGPVRDTARALLTDDVIAAAKAWIQARNALFHPTGSYILDPNQSAAALASLREPLRVLMHAVAPLGDVPVFYEKSRTRTPEGECLSLWQFSGRDRTFVGYTVKHSKLLSNEVFALEPNGRVLYLAPLVVVSTDQRDLFLLATACTPPEWSSSSAASGPTDPVRLDLLKKSLPSGSIDDDAAKKLAGWPPLPAKPIVDGIDITKSLGHGATATVWRGQHHRLGRSVAVKVLHPHITGPASLARVRREVKRGLQLRHDNLVPVLEQAQTSEGLVAIVQELVEGPALSELLTKRSYSPDDVRRWALDLARVLSYLHSQDLVHRDIKPDNLLLGADRHLRLVDLGLISAGDDVRVTKTGVDLGTLAWSAPEQLRGDPAQPSSDVYAAGKVIGALLKAIQAPYTDGLRAIARRATAASPDDRYANGEELLRALLNPELSANACPVTVGDRVGDTWKVASAGTRLEKLNGQVWAVSVDGVNEAHYLLLSGHPNGRAALELTAKRAGRPLEKTSDGLVYLAVPPDKLQATVDGTPAPPTWDPTTLALGAAAGVAGAAVVAAAVLGTGASAAGMAAAAHKNKTGRAPPAVFVCVAAVHGLFGVLSPIFPFLAACNSKPRK